MNNIELIRIFGLCYRSGVLLINSDTYPEIGYITNNIKLFRILGLCYRSGVLLINSDTWPLLFKYYYNKIIVFKNNLSVRSIRTENITGRSLIFLSRKNNLKKRNNVLCPSGPDVAVSIFSGGLK